MSDIFLSYSREDKDRVDLLARTLRASGLSVFWDNDITPGTPSYIAAIEHELQEARCVLVVWSLASRHSDWVINEALVAKNREVLLPVLIDDIDPPPGFLTIQGIDLPGWPELSNYEEELARVLESVFRFVRPGESHPAILPAGQIAIVGREAHPGESPQREPTGAPTLSGGFPMYRRVRSRIASHRGLADGNIPLRARTLLIDRTQAIWIDGRLKRQLSDEVRIRLSLQELPDLVKVAAGDNQAPIPLGAPLIELFKRSGQHLLIVGQPGFGKTTLALSLTRHLLEVAAINEERPVPMVFPLAAWATSQGSMEDWLAQVLHDRYDVSSRAVAHEWLRRHLVIPVLDGLDEVPLAYRDECVRALNELADRRGTEPLIVCCRTAEYYALNERLKLRRAVEIQPLTDQQIDGYLTRLGAEWAPVRTALREGDPHLRDLLGTPLQLHVAALAYSTGDPKGLANSHAPLAERTEELWDTYLTTMADRQEPTDVGIKVTSENRWAWLDSLASNMRDGGITEFYLDELRPSRAWRWAVPFVAGLLVSGLGLAALLLHSWLIGPVDHYLDPRDGGFTLRDWIGSVWIWVIACGPFVAVGLALPAKPIVSARVRPLRIAFGIPIGAAIGWTVAWVLWWFRALSVDAIDLSEFTRQLVPLGMAAGMLMAINVPAASDVGPIRRDPMSHIRRSAKRGLAQGVVVGLMAATMGYFVNDPWGGGLVGFLAFGLVATATGGGAAIHHWAARLELALRGEAPLRYVTFLEWASGRLYLWRVGAGYQFIHRLLLEHLASDQRTPVSPASTRERRFVAGSAATGALMTAVGLWWEFSFSRISAFELNNPLAVGVLCASVGAGALTLLSIRGDSARGLSVALASSIVGLLLLLTFYYLYLSDTDDEGAGASRGFYVATVTTAATTVVLMLATARSGGRRRRLRRLLMPI